MIVREAPQPVRAPDPTEALIREARQRQRRRWALIAVLLFRTKGLALGPRGEIYVAQAGSGGWDTGFRLLVEIEPDGDAKMLPTHPA